MNKLLALAALTLAVLPACQTMGDDGIRVIQPKDLPVPFGMVLRTNQYRSDSLELGTPGQTDRYRYANLVYEGRNSPLEVSTYLLDRLPLHSYRLVSQDKLAEEGEQLVFARGPYLATCIVRKLDRRTQLEIQLRTQPKL